MQPVVCNNPCSFFRIIWFPDDGRPVSQCFKMTVNAILCYIQFGAPKPLNFWFLKIPFKHFVPFFSPLKMLCNRCPELLRFIYADTVSHFILVHAGDLERI